MTVRLLLRLEGLAIATGAVVLYADGDPSWWLFALLILAPDLSFLGYLAGPRVAPPPTTCSTTSSCPSHSERPRCWPIRTQPSPSR
jgi:hypothetical protein